MTTFRIGHSGITWSYSVDTAEAAVKDLAELGYSAYETFGTIIERYDEEHPEGFDGLLKRYGLPLSAVYCNVAFHSPTHAMSGAVTSDVIRLARRGREIGAETLVLTAGGKQGRPYTHETQWEGMAFVFNRIGAGVAQLGMAAALHPHTGTLVETRAEIDAIMGRVDPDLIGLAPDTGHLQKSGVDVLATLRAYKERIWHVHLKDYGGGRETDYAGFAPVGQGTVDIPGVFQILEEVNYARWITVELNCEPESPRLAREGIALSKRYLEELLGERTGWKA